MGWILATVEHNEMEWAVVAWDGDDDPDLHKMYGLDVAETTWRKAK